MEFIIDELSDLGIIKINVSGNLNQETRKEILSKAVSELNTKGYQKLLVDATGSKVSKNDTARIIHALNMVDSIKKIEKKNHIQ
jgi:hypothetical protein